MKPTEHIANTASTPKTGFFALLRGLFPAQGTGAPKMGLVALAATLGALAFTSAPALAAAPEIPELKVEPIWAATATFNGTLNPHASAGEPGTYKYLYKQGSSCVGGIENGGIVAGEPGEVLPVEVVKGLIPSSEYTVCLSFTSTATTETSETTVTFKTTAAAKPEAPEATEATERKATTATLNGVVNPLKEGEPGKYRFLYKQSASICTGETETIEEEAPGVSPLPVSVAVGGLEGGKPYTFCVEAFNALGEATLSAPKTFETAITPETPEATPPKPQEIAATTATLNGVLNPKAAGNPGTYEFRYRKSASECQGGEPGEEIATPATAATGAEKEPVTAPVKELLPHTAYTFCLLARNEAGEESTLAGPVTFTTLAAAPKVEEASVADVSSTAVTFSATVNPEGAETTYTFEDAPAGGTFAPVSEPEGSGSIPAGLEGVPLSVHVQHGLAPNTAYEFRLVAHNPIETVTGEPVSFTTQRTGSALALPDGRQWEMVTPPDKHGTLIKAWQLGYNADVQVSEHGDAVIDEESAPSETEPQGYNNDIMVLSTRGSKGWSSESLGVPRDDGSGPGVAGLKEYHFFSEDLSLGLVNQLAGFTPLSPEASEQTPYVHTDYLNGNPADRCESSYQAASSCYRPLVSGCPAEPAECKPSIKEHADVPPGTEFGGEIDNQCESGLVRCGPNFVDATPDMSHILLSSCAALTTDATGGCGGEAPLANIYEWSEGQLQSLPAPLAGVEFHGYAGLQERELHAMSDSGQRVILENGEGAGQQLLLRVNSMMPQSPISGGECTVPTDACSIQINENQGGSGSSSEGRFQVASSDDSRVFFLDDSRLTSDSTAESGEPDLYEYDLAKPTGERLSDLSVGQSGAVRVTEVLGASEDGSYVYFTAVGAIAGTGAHPSVCDTNVVAVAERQQELEALTCNVYVRHDGVTRLVASAGPLLRSAQVSPDGRYLEFMSDKDLTGYDTRDALSGKPDLEVYEYNAETEKMACTSCNPTGARPIGTEDQGGEVDLEGTESTYDDNNEGAGWMAAGIPTWHDLNSLSSNLKYEARDLSDSGRVFFDSDEALVPQDINAREDVYEYEPAGVGSCTVESPTYGGRSGGCVSLISSGTSPQVAAFLGASEGGGDVFFVTTSKLAPQDYDTAYDVYDAHVCTSESPCPAPAGESPPPCDTEASCKASPTPQPEIYGAPSSATFSGPGNVTQPSPSGQKITTKTVKCKRGFVKNKKNKCVRKKKTKAKKSAHTNRRAK